MMGAIGRPTEPIFLTGCFAVRYCVGANILPANCSPAANVSMKRSSAVVVALRGNPFSIFKPSTSPSPGGSPPSIASTPATNGAVRVTAPAPSERVAVSTIPGASTPVSYPNSSSSGPNSLNTFLNSLLDSPSSRLNFTSLSSFVSVNVATIYLLMPSGLFLSQSLLFHISQQFFELCSTLHPWYPSGLGSRRQPLLHCRCICLCKIK